MGSAFVGNQIFPIKGGAETPPPTPAEVKAITKEAADKAAALAAAEVYQIKEAEQAQGDDFYKPTTPPGPKIPPFNQILYVPKTDKEGYEGISGRTDEPILVKSTKYNFFGKFTIEKIYERFYKYQTGDTVIYVTYDEGTSSGGQPFDKIERLKNLFPNGVPKDLHQTEIVPESTFYKLTPEGYEEPAPKLVPTAPPMPEPSAPPMPEEDLTKKPSAPPAPEEDTSNPSFQTSNVDVTGNPSNEDDGDPSQLEGGKGRRRYRKHA